MFLYVVSRNIVHKKAQFHLLLHNFQHAKEFNLIPIDISKKRTRNILVLKRGLTGYAIIHLQHFFVYSYGSGKYGSGRPAISYRSLVKKRGEDYDFLSVNSVTGTSRTVDKRKMVSLLGICSPDS